MGKVFFTVLGAIIGYAVGLMIAVTAGMIWANLFPSPDLPNNPQAGMDTVFALAMAGQAVGLIAGGIVGWRKA